MSKTPISPSQTIKNRYWSGVFVGLLLGVFVVTGALLLLIRFHGLQIAVNPDQMAKMIQQKIKTEARKDIPGILEELKQELPNEMSKNLADLDQLTIGIGNHQMKLPQEVINSLKEQFNRIVSEAVLNTINHYDTSKYEERMSKNAYDLVNNIFRQEVFGKTYLIQASSWLHIPIRIVSNNSKESFGTGI